MRLMKKKKMRYVRYVGKEDAPSVLLYSGQVKGHRVAIINTFGTHPCAYVEVDNRINENDISCHGGITYVDDGELLFVGETNPGKVWFGWDYGHLYDYKPSVKGYKRLYRGYVKHTTEEVYRDIIDVVKQVRKLEADLS